MSTATPTIEAPSAPAPARRRARATLAALLVLVIGLSVVSAIVSSWADDAVYDPDIMIAAFGDLPSDPVQAERLGDWIASEAVTGLSVEERLNAALPIGLSLFSGPLTNGIEQAAANVSSSFIQTDLFADIWEDALPLAHATMVDALRGDETAVLRADGGVVTVDISLAILAVYERVIDVLPDIAENGMIARITGLEPGELETVIDGWVLEYLPPDLGTFVLIESEALASLQAWTTTLERLAWVSLLAALLAAAAALLITPAPGRTLLAIVAAAVAGIALGAIVVRGAEQAAINALRDLPFESGGFDPTALLTGWWLALIGFIVLAIGVGIAGWVIRWRQAGASTPYPQADLASG